MKKNSFNYSLENKTILLNTAIDGLRYKVNDDDFEVYVEHLKKEIAVFEEMNFDGYMLLLYNMVKTSREMNIFISCFGSIQYSLVAYALEITQHYNFKGFSEFLNFTAFEKEPTINIVSSSSRTGEIISYLDAKYLSLIKKLVYNKSVLFHDNLTLKFIDLGVDNEVQHSQKEKEYLFDNISSLKSLEQYILDK